MPVSLSVLPVPLVLPFSFSRHFLSFFEPFPQGGPDLRVFLVPAPFTPPLSSLCSSPLFHEQTGLLGADHGVFVLHFSPSVVACFFFLFSGGYFD